VLALGAAAQQADELFWPVVAVLALGAAARQADELFWPVVAVLAPILRPNR
jgi:hypothetical protein